MHEAALELGLTVRTPATLKEPAEQAALAGLRADLVVVGAYGLILPKTILETPRLGCINLHASLLPRWRGAAPIQRALLAGDRETGVTVIQMEPSLDTGPILAQEPVRVDPVDDEAELHERIKVVERRLLVEVVAAVATRGIVSDGRKAVIPDERVLR